MVFQMEFTLTKNPYNKYLFPFLLLVLCCIMVQKMDFEEAEPWLFQIVTTRGLQQRVVLLHVTHNNWLNPAATPLGFLQLGEVFFAREKYIFMHTSTCIVLSTRMNL